MIEIAGILLLGIGAQWLAWRLRIPSILLLLLIGFTVGPFTRQALLDPEAMFGETLRPIVALSVAVILFDGGLSLRFRELKGTGWAVTSLIVIGPVLTFAAVTTIAHWPLGFGWRPAALLGAILVVTGPTVIGPLLRSVRPAGAVGRIVHWEGIVTDPIGAIVAVLVFQAFLHGDPNHDIALVGLGKAMLAGGGMGAMGGFVVAFLLKKKLVPDFLHAPVTLAIALFAFVVSDEIQHESGLLAVTLMGVLLANQRKVAIEHIVEFGENVRVILVSTLFIVLAARLPLEVFTQIDLRSIAFVVLLILVVRPVVVFLATIGAGLKLNERVFIAWMAPRGIVAAAVAVAFAEELDAELFPEATQLVPVVFLVIIATVLVYGLTAGPLARRLGLSRGAPQGVLFFGAHAWARAMAKSLAGAGLDVLLVDTNYREVQAARIDGLRAHYGNILAHEFELRVPLDGIGHLVSQTHNDEVNALACIQFTSTFGRGQVHQLVPDDDEPGGEELPSHLRGHALYGSQVHYWTLESRFRGGAVVKRTQLSEEFGYEQFLEEYATPDAPVIPLFIIDSDKKLEVLNVDEPVKPGPGDTIVALVDPPAA